MRLKRSRLNQYYHRAAAKKKDKEGSSYTEYEPAKAFCGEVWPASGKVQAEMYGERLSYIRNVRIDGKYVITTDRTGKEHYVFTDSLDITENDGMCLYASEGAEPDYRIISIRPYRFLKLEAEKL